MHREIFNIIDEKSRIAIAAPRKSGKSEIISFGWVVWSLLLNPLNRFTIIISNNYSNACKYLTPIKEELENNKLLNGVFKIVKREKWSENEIELTIDGIPKKIIVGGNDFKIRGQKFLENRPDLIIIDDAEDDEMVKSQPRREDFEHWLLYSLDPALSIENNKIIVVGTILHRDSQLSKLMTGEGKYRDWFTKLYQAIKDNKALWEEGLGLEWLLNEKNKDPYKFAQEYMNTPVPYEYSMFKNEYFDDYAEPPKDLLINITVDLACSDKNYSDYTVIMPCGIDMFGDLWVLPYIRGRYIDPDEILDQMFKAYLRYANSGNIGWKFGKFGIEKVAFQRFLIKNFNRERKKRGLRFPVVELDARGDKVTRISQLQPLFASGDIHMRSSMIDLKEELLDFPRARHDDTAESLCMHLNFMDRKPLKHIITEEKWSVTPEKQRLRMLKGRINFRPKVYSKF